MTGRRADGYHRIDSLVCFAEDGDRLDVSPDDADRLDVTGPFAGLVPGGTGNLVLAALDLARSHLAAAGRAVPPLAIRLDKRLPVSSGIGGGSSDAAALLRILSRTAPDLADALARASVALGADVPMCVAGAPCRVTGIGEAIEPLPRFPSCALVLVNPGTPVSTPDVFRALARPDNPPLPALPAGGFADVRALVAYLETTRNDLEGPALGLAPVIAEARGALVGHDALFAGMSGSGATVFGLFADDLDAKRAAGAIAVAHPGWWVLQTRTRPT